MPNTITDTITELADSKSDIQDALVAKGVTLAAGHGFNKFAEDIATIVTVTGGHEVIVTTLPNAVVTISDSSNTYTATANENGIASFTGVVAGTYTVTASIEGAQIGSTSLTVTDFTANLRPVVYCFT